MKLRQQQRMQTVPFENNLNEDEEQSMENKRFNHLSNENPQELETKLTVLEKGIEQLSLEQKRCIELFYLHEKSYKEIVELTGYDLLKVKSYIQNGKRNLKIYLEKHDDIG
jgi:RNA polymerase sigma-70 factor (ECF subfamily)